MWGCIHEVFEKQVKRHPNRVAIQFESENLTYQELNQQANTIAAYLQQQGLTAGELVAVSMERSLELVVALLSILKAGAAYVPLEPTYPQSRLTQLFKDSKAKLVLTQKKFSKLWQEQHALVLDAIEDLDYGIPQISSLDDTHLCYVIYTSGSTGKPKGVALEHRAVMNRLNWMQRCFPIDETDVVLQKTPFSFDVSVWEFFWPLLNGAKLVLATPEGHKDPQYLAKLIQKEQVTITHFVPAMLAMFLSVPEASHCHSLRHVFSSGEALPSALVNQFNQNLRAQLHNLYGPTEAAIDVSSWTSPKDKLVSIVPIGQPIDNLELYILDASLNPVRNGESGELYIAGVGLARGYWQQPDLTAQQFIYHAPIQGGETKRLYKTGDLARWLPDGNIEYLGRLDEQVKIRGFRIELGEIEQVLLSLSSIQQAVVVVRDDIIDAQKQLVAYLVPMGQAFASNIDLIGTTRKYLASQLPEYMVPHYFVELDSLPLTTSGKVDKKLLPHPLKRTTKDDMVSHKVPEGTVEGILLDIWQRLLGDTVKLQDNFFALGGDSILAIKMLQELACRGLRLSIHQVLQYPTIAELSEKAIQIDKEESCHVLEESQNQFPLSMIQKGLLFHAFYAPKSDAYLVQSVFHLDKKTNLAHLKQSWEKVFQDESILRTYVDWENAEKPQQHVVPFCEIPWCEVYAEEQVDEVFLQDFLNRDRQNLFSLNEAPLCRLTLLFLSEQWVLVFTWHHIILDGWSLENLIGRVSAHYAYLCGNKALEQLPAVNYEQFVKKQQAKSYQEHEKFWVSALQGLETCCTHFYLEPNTVRYLEPKYQSYLTLFDEEDSEALHEFSKKNQITVSTLFEAAWSMLLSCYLGNNDVIFGMTFSGRIVDLPGINEMLGCFINTVPVRIQLQDAETVRTLLYRMTDLVSATSQFSDAALSYVNVWSPRPDKDCCLFNHILVIDSFEEKLKDNTLMSLKFQVERTEYPLMVKISPQKQIKIQIGFESPTFDFEQIKVLVEKYKVILKEVIRDPLQRIGELKKVSLGEPLRDNVILGVSSASFIDNAQMSKRYSDLEKQLIILWQDLLKIDEVNLDDNFFHIGGQSLLALSLMLKIRKKYLIDFTLKDLIESPTIEGMSAKIQQLRMIGENATVLT